MITDILRRETESNTPQIARVCRVSEAVVSRIIESKEGLQEYLIRKQTGAIHDRQQSAEPNSPPDGAQ